MIRSMEWRCVLAVDNAIEPHYGWKRNRHQPLERGECYEEENNLSLKEKKKKPEKSYCFLIHVLKVLAHKALSVYVLL